MARISTYLGNFSEIRFLKKNSETYFNNIKLSKIVGNVQSYLPKDVFQKYLQKGFSDKTDRMNSC